MTAINGPADVASEWSKAFANKDLGAMMELFEPDAIWVSDDGKVVEGLDSIREVFADFLALGAVFNAETPQIIETAGIALVCSRWTVRGEGADGTAIDIAGRTADVMRRGSDGRWRYLIDAPYAGA